MASAAMAGSTNGPRPPEPSLQSAGRAAIASSPTAPAPRKWQATRWLPGAGAGLEQLRRLLHAAHRAAERGAELAAGVEPAARRRPDRARDVALEDDALPALLGIGDGDRRQQRLRVRVERRLEHRDPVGHLGDAADVHDRHPVADVLDDAHVVGDEQVGQVELALERLEQVQHLGLDGHVEGGHGLVAHQQVRLDDQRAGDADPLPLAAAELVRVATGVVGHEADEVHHPAHLRGALRRGADAVDPQALADAVADRRSRIERRVRVLEDDLHPPPERLEGAALDLRDVGPVERDRARRGLDQPQEQPPDRRLARSRLAHEPERLAAADVEADPGHGLDDGHLAG